MRPSATNRTTSRSSQPGRTNSTRRSAVRLEQIYAAFARFLPPTVRDGRPTLIMLATDDEEYKALLGPLGKPDLLNPAVFDPASNRVLCGTELKRLGAELQAARPASFAATGKLEEIRDGGEPLYKQPELQRYLNASSAETKRIHKAEAANGKEFDQVTARLRGPVPRGLSCLCGHVCLQAARVVTRSRPGRGTGESPRVAQRRPGQVSRRPWSRRASYGPMRRTPCACWTHQAEVEEEERSAARSTGDALDDGEGDLPRVAQGSKGSERLPVELGPGVFPHLRAPRHRQPAFRKYLVAINLGEDATRAFTELVGQDLSAFEKDWYAYLLRLQKDGTLSK